MNIEKDVNDNTLVEQLSKTQKVVEEKSTPEEKKEAPAEDPQGKKAEEAPLAEIKDEKSLEELLGGEEGDKPDTTPKEPEQPESKESVPLSVHLEIKNELKELKKLMKDKIVSGDEVDEIADEIAEKYDTNSDFIKDLLRNSLPVLEKRIDTKYASLIKKQEVERVEEKKDKLFGQLFDTVMSSNPELKEVVNKDVIKKLALDPSNSKKKLTEIIKEVYGGVKITTTKKSFDGYSPTGDKGDVDFTNADPEQMKLVASDKKLRKEFGDHLVKNMNW